MIHVFEASTRSRIRDESVGLATDTLSLRTPTCVTQSLAIPALHH